MLYSHQDRVVSLAVGVNCLWSLNDDCGLHQVVMSVAVQCKAYDWMRSFVEQSGIDWLGAFSGIAL